MINRPVFYRECLAIGIAILLGAPALSGIAAAGEPSFPPMTQASPEQEIKKWFKDLYALVLTGDHVRLRAQYAADTVLEKTLADAFYQYILAEVPYEQALRDRFGNELAATVIRAIGDFPLTDVDTLAITLDGNRATVEPVTVDNPTYLIRTPEGWKFSMRGWVARMAREDIKEVAQFNEALAETFRKLLERLKAGEFKTGEEARVATMKALESLQK